jgi:hypothetical protein
VAGVRHRLAGQAGEDSFAWAHTPGRLAVGVADGLGSVPGSGGCAARAAAAACAAAAASPADLAGALVEGLQAGNEAAAGGGATTLVLAVVEESGRVELGRIGDSTAFVLGGSPAGWVDVFDGFEPGPDDGIETATDALPRPDLHPERAHARIGGEAILVLASDGVAGPWRDGPTTVAPVLGQALAEPPPPLELARLVDFSRRGCHDDRTLVAIWLFGSDGSEGRDGSDGPDDRPDPTDRPAAAGEDPDADLRA